MREGLAKLQASMEHENIDIWLIPCRDAHGSEFIGERDKCTEELSGFTGDSCEMAVFRDEAFLWTDGRYFEQAEKELSGSGISLMRMGEPGVPTLDAFLKERLSKGQTLAFYAPLFGASRGEKFKLLADGKEAFLVTDRDPADVFWEARPSRSCQPVRLVPERYTGRSSAEKLSDIRAVMKNEGAGVFFTGALDETAWVTNLRGGDIACNPLFLSYLLVKEAEALLFVQEEALTDDAREYLGRQGIGTRPYDCLRDALAAIRGEKVLADLSSTSFAVRDIFMKGGNTIIGHLSPAARLKCVKNAVEQKGMRSCHVRDGAYLTKYLYWLKKRISSGKKLTETEAADYLDSLRKKDRKFVDLSFPTISAYGPNAAMAHYQAEEGGALLKKRGLYLVDSGAHYLDGTTDVTRTIALGPLTKEEKRHCTLTVIGMLRLMNAVFPRGARGCNLDTIARDAMWRQGIDFNHGTGHGVGCLNVVHEGPVSVRMRPGADPGRDIPFEPGMVTSDEPGVYVEGKHGVRTENLLLCVPHKTYKGFLCFEPLTMAPLDPEIIDLSLMTDEDKALYNAYQALVYRRISPKLTEEERNWLRDETRAV